MNCKRFFFIVAALCLTAALSAQSVREKIRLDEGWKFAFGHAADPAKDFGCVIYSSPSFTAGSRILVSAQAETEGPAEAKPEWDTSVPAEITDEVRTLFDEAMKGLLGINYEPLAVLAQQGETVCILCRASAVVPDAKPNYALVYLSTGNGSPVCEQISELPLDLAA